MLLGQLVGEVRERFGLSDAVAVPAAHSVGSAELFVAVGVVAGAGAALRLEVVGDDEELIVSDLGVGRREERSERSACVDEVLVVEFGGRAVDVGDLSGLIDECGADHVVADLGQLGCRHKRPAVGACGCVELLDEVCECGIAFLVEVGRILDLFQCDDGCVELVDRGDDLLLLPQEVLGVEGAAGAAEVRGDGVAVAVGVGRASGFGVAEGGEVVQHVERCNRDVTADICRCRLSDIAECHR